MATNDKQMTTKQAFEELRQTSGIEKEQLRRILILCEFAMRRKDGKPTKFAKKFGITTYEDFYKFMKTVKENLKKDHETIAFTNLTEMWKSVAARCQNWFQEWNNDLNDRDALFYASIFTQRTTGMMLDNLKRLKTVIKRMEELKEHIIEYVGEQKAKKSDRT